MNEDVLCPNCSYPVGERPVVCPRCGYRSELAPEYFWLYAGGGAFVLLGFAFGVTSLVVGEPSAGHWSDALRGWYPLGPWPRSLHWLAFLVEGIGLTTAGLGITRHRSLALVLLAAFLLPDAVFTARKLVAGGPGDPAPFLAGSLFAFEGLLLALAARIAIALRRTPRRDVARLQAGRRGNGTAPEDGPTG